MSKFDKRKNLENDPSIKIVLPDVRLENIQFWITYKKISKRPVEEGRSACDVIKPKIENDE